MQLLYQTHSPYARKVLVFAYEAGIADRLEVLHHETSPMQRNDDVFAVNPLGKVPVLIHEDGFALFDSLVICAYLDGLHDGPKLIPEDGRARFSALRLQALADGLSDAGFAVRGETEPRPEGLRYPPLRDGQIAKLIAGYDFLEQDGSLEGSVTIGHITLATSLSWLEFRNLPSFKQDRPRLTAWYEPFIDRPSMLATPLAGDIHD